MESDTVVMRGFSNTFGFDRKVDPIDLQFIEGEELERTWKVARRQRLKQQEEKIWSEFVKEEDVLQSVCKEDPYQFLEQIAPEQVNELVETELARIKKELEDKHGAGDSPRSPRCDKPAVVTFNEVEGEEVFEIYDENCEDSDQANEENLNDTLDSPCTVRERDDTSGENSERDRDMRGKPFTVARASGASVPPSVAPKHSNENVATVIESSIYCAKVKDLRIKIINEMQDMIMSLENQNVASLDPFQLRKLCKRAAEYSQRFQRIHLYQLQRQVNDIKRHISMATPFAKHTQFQSQMVRIVTLHANTLQSLQVFHKSFEQTACLRECSTQLRAICATLRDSTAACLDVAVPTDFYAAKDMYNDNLLSVCDDLERAVEHYIARVDEYIGAAELHAAKSKRSAKGKAKKKSSNNWSQNATKNTTSEANQSLSMYSLDTLRLNSRPSVKTNNTKSEKSRWCDTSRVSKRGRIEKETPKSHRRTPRRRPLMRDPHLGLEKRARAQPDHEISTMVENVYAQSSYAGDTSPNSPDRRSITASPRKRMDRSPAFQHPIVPPIALNSRSGTNPKNSPKVPSPAFQPPIVPPIALNSRSGTHAKNSPKVPTKRMSPYIKSCNFNQRGEAADTVNTVQNSGRVNRNDDLQTQTVGCKQTRERIVSPRRECGQSSPPACSRCRPDSARSDCSRGSPHSAAAATPRGARDHAREAEGFEMTRLLKHLCAGDNIGNKNDRLTGSKNAQLVCVNANSPRQPTTPQLLKILEETIQKKIPKHLYKMQKPKDADQLRLAFNIPQQIADNLFQYRTKFVQHMLTSPMYANSTIGKPWEMVGSVSEQIIDEILLQCAEEMEIKPYIMELYNAETK